MQAVTVITPLAGEAAAKAAVSRASVLAEAVHLARDLVNTPPSDLRPPTWPPAAQEAAGVAGLEVEILDEKQLKKGGYGGIVGVGPGLGEPAAAGEDHLHATPRPRSTSPWSARASPSTPAASRSSRPTPWTR